MDDDTALLRIGDLARLGGVSVRMLRHYHEVGVLVPEVDIECGPDRAWITELQLAIERS